MRPRSRPTAMLREWRSTTWPPRPACSSATCRSAAFWAPERPVPALRSAAVLSPQFAESVDDHLQLGLVGEEDRVVEGHRVVPGGLAVGELDLRGVDRRLVA